jgi:hypothetical protein
MRLPLQQRLRLKRVLGNSARSLLHLPWYWLGLRV